MNEITMDAFYDGLMPLIDNLLAKEQNKIVEAAQVIAKTAREDGVVHVFGAGHSLGFAWEMQNRVGSLACIHKMEPSDFVLRGRVTEEEFRDKKVFFERKLGLAEQFFDLYQVQPQDSFIIISNSGINGIVIDMALAARERGNPVIVVTSWEHTSSEESRHPSGYKLYQLGDVVIDNCCPKGDALLDTGKLEKICSVSAIMCAFIAQSLSTETCRILQEQHQELPVYWDEQLPGAREHNERLRGHYRSRV